MTTLSSRPAGRAGGTSPSGVHVPGLLSVLAVALAARILFFTGPLGSDEVVYIERALDILSGTWSTSTYIGGVRYGVNIPMAVLLALFGRNEPSASLFALLPSLAEVAVVYWFASRIWGRREALPAALVLAVLPLHVHLAGRLMHDPANALFITLTFVCFYVGELRSSPRWFFLCGLAAGAAFWVREVSIVFVAVFGVYAIVYRRWSPQWLWAAAGAFLALVTNLVLFWWIAGDPWHGFRTLATQGMAGWSDPGIYEGSPDFYFRYLLVDVKHTWLMGILAAAGVAAWLRHPRTEERHTGYVVLWMAGMLSLFSFLPVSLDPVLFIRKQTNYMALFMAPLALMSGYALARVRSAAWRSVAVSVVVGGSLVLCALEQQVIRAETAIGKGAVLFAGSHPEYVVYGTGRASNVSMYYRMLSVDGYPPVSILPLDPLETAMSGPQSPAGSAPSAGDRVVVLEPAGTSHAHYAKPARVVECWRQIAEVRPTGLGIGGRVLDVVGAISHRLPRAIEARLQAAMKSLQPPPAAPVFEVPAGCPLQ